MEAAAAKMHHLSIKALMIACVLHERGGRNPQIPAVRVDIDSGDRGHRAEPAGQPLVRIPQTMATLP